MNNNYQQELVTKMYDEYIKNGLTMDQIGKKYGRNKQWVSRLFQKYGYKSKSMANAPITNKTKYNVYTDDISNKNVPKELLDVKPVKSIRAFSNKHYDYYELNCDLGKLKEGAIFYHDKTTGGEGSLKLCWGIFGNTQGYSGGSVIFPFDMSRSSVFKKIEAPFTRMANMLPPGEYKLIIKDDGEFTINN